MPKVTIIVPIYNAEKYLYACVDSVLEQTYKDFELLLIDDGSKDNSGIICDEYAKKDGRIRVFHKQNGGVSSARNMGLDNAIGEWILFVDADDYITPECLGVLMSTSNLTCVDIIQYSYFRVTEHGNVLKRKSDCGNTRFLTKKQYISSRKMTFCVCGTLYRHFTVKNIRFDETLKLAEDQLFVMQAMRGAENVAKIEIPMYAYRINPRSVTHNSRSQDAYQSMLKLATVVQSMPMFKYQIDTMVVQFVFIIIRNGDYSNYDKRLKCLFMWENPQVMRYNTWKKNVFILLAKVDFSFACLLFQRMNRLFG